MNIIKSLPVSVATFLFFYLLACFYNTSFDIRLWTEFSRYCTSIIGGMLSISCAGIYLFNDKINNNDN